MAVPLLEKMAVPLLETMAVSIAVLRPSQKHCLLFSLFQPKTTTYYNTSNKHPDPLYNYINNSLQQP
jgi:hypothetical protein